MAAELEAARARAAETKRLQDEGTRKAAEEAAGQERLKDVRENQSWLDSMARSWAIRWASSQLSVNGQGDPPKKRRR